MVVPNSVPPGSSETATAGGRQGGWSGGETGVLGRLLARLPRAPAGERWAGDDAAVLEVAPGRCVVSCDTAVAGVHADLGVLSEADLGWRAVAGALSDLAAMAAEPVGVLLGLTVPRDGAPEAVLEGAVACAEAHGVPVVGGDLSEAPVVTLCVSVVGRTATAFGPVGRDGARPGDWLALTGPVGAAAAGLRVLREAGARDGRLDPNRGGCAPGEEPSGAAWADLVRAHRRPRARLAEGLAAGRAGVRAMVDVSDGLALDLHRLADASGVGVVLWDVPVAPGARFEEAVGGGEDYELVMATADLARLQTGFARAGLSEPLVVGRVVADPEHRTWRGEPLPRAGYEHGRAQGPAGSA